LRKVVLTGSVAALLKTYAKCIEGQDETARRRIQEALRDGEDQSAKEQDEEKDG